MSPLSPYPTLVRSRVEGEYLGIAGTARPVSYNVNGVRYVDIHFDLRLNGPKKGETSELSAGLKADDGGAEASLGVKESTTISSQGSRPFGRVYRITGLSKPTTYGEFDWGTHQLTTKNTQLELEELADRRLDVSDFELDDDDVGDGLFTLYANWIVHSYSD